jgi:hypothetical protein
VVGGTLRIDETNVPHTWAAKINGHVPSQFRDGVESIQDGDCVSRVLTNRDSWWIAPMRQSESVGSAIQRCWDHYSINSVLVITIWAPTGCAVADHLERQGLIEFVAQS